MIGIAGAFAFSSVPDTDSKAVAQFLGHYKVGGVCTSGGVMCQDINNGQPCVSGANVLYKKLSNTNCPDQLWRIIP